MSNKHTYDNSQVGTYRKCPMSYYLQYIRGLVKTDSASNDTLHLDFGSAFHEFLELYYARKIKGAEHKGIDLVKVWSVFNDREGEKVKTYDNGISLCKAYVAHYEHLDEFEVLEVEEPIEVDLEGLRFIVKRDGVISLNDNIYTLEHKTTGRLGYGYFDQYFINSQVSAQTYVTLLSHKECSGVMLNVAQPAFTIKNTLLDPDAPEVKGFSDVEIKHNKYHKRTMAHCKGFNCKFERDVISRTTEELEDWKSNTIAWIDKIEESRNKNVWLKNDGGWECKMCQYRELCKVSKGTELDEMILDVLYEETNPLEYLGLTKEGEKINENKN